MSDDQLTLIRLGVGGGPRQHASGYFASAGDRYTSILTRGGDPNVPGPETAMLLGVDYLDRISYCIDSMGGTWQNKQLTVSGGFGGFVDPVTGYPNISRVGQVNCDIQYMIAGIADIPAPGLVGATYLSQRILGNDGLHFVGVARSGEYEIAIDKDGLRFGSALDSTHTNQERLASMPRLAQVAPREFVLQGSLRQDTAGLVRPEPCEERRGTTWVTPGETDDVVEICVRVGGTFVWRVL